MFFIFLNTFELRGSPENTTMKISLVSVTTLLGFVLLVGAAKGHMAPGLEKDINACLKELDMTMDDVMERRENGQAEKADCLSACVAKKAGFVKEDGSFDSEAILAKYHHLPRYLPSKDLLQMIETCAETKTDDSCETSALFHSCIDKARTEAERPFRKLVQGCVAQLGATGDDIVKNGCLGACVGKAFGIVNQDGTLNVAAYLEKIDAKNFAPKINNDEFKAIVEKCGKLTGKNDCESAVMAEKCFVESGLHVGYPI